MVTEPRIVDVNNVSPTVETPPAEPLSTSLRACTTEEALESVGNLTNLAIDALEAILRNPARYSKHIVGAANLVLQRKLGAVPDTVIQNNMQFIVKWEE